MIIAVSGLQCLRNSLILIFFFFFVYVGLVFQGAKIGIIFELVVEIGVFFCFFGGWRRKRGEMIFFYYLCRMKIKV